MTSGSRAQVVRPASGGGRGFTLARYGLRAHRRASSAFAVLGLLVPALTGATYVAAAGTTAAARTAFGRTTSVLGTQLAYLVPLPVHPGTAAGYIWWKGLSFVPVVFAAWAVGAATGTVRNEEERGVLETWLSTSLSRPALLLQRTLAFSACALGVVCATAAGTWLGVQAAGATVSIPQLAQQGSALLGFTLLMWAIGLLAAQLTGSRRSAVATAGVFLLALYLLDVAARVNPALATMAAISPFRLVDLTTAVVPGGTFAAAATAALFALAVPVLLLAAAAFNARDLGSPLLALGARRSVRRGPASAPRLIRVPVISALWEQRAALLAWCLGTGAGAAIMVSVARSTASFLKSSATFRVLLRTAGAGPPSLVIISEFWFGIAAIVVAAYAVTQASRWASEDANGRLEMELAQPVPRWRVVLERAAALVLGLSLITAAGGLVVGLTAPAQGLDLPVSGVVAASALLLPLGASFGALGAVIIARAPRAAVPLLGLVAASSYYIATLGPALKWPGWALDLSLLKLYRTPLTTGVYWTGLAVMLGVVLIGFGGAAAAMRTREVGR